MFMDCMYVNSKAVIVHSAGLPKMLKQTAVIGSTFAFETKRRKFET